MVIASERARITSYYYNTSREKEVDDEKVFNVPSSSGLANETISSGNTSDTPPTRVLTTYRPAHAASKMAIPKASVKDVFRKIEPWIKTYILGVKRSICYAVKLNALL